MADFDPKQTKEMRPGPLSEGQFQKFNQATRSHSVKGMHPAFPTIFRDSEFQWVEKTGVDLRRLLHVDQQYECISPLKPGDSPVISTAITSIKERRSLQFLTLESRITVEGELKVIGTTNFVIRGEESK